MSYFMWQRDVSFDKILSTTKEMCKEGIAGKGGGELQELIFKEGKELDTHIKQVNVSVYISTNSIDSPDKSLSSND